MSKSEEFPVFTLAQANLLVPKLVEITSETVNALEQARSRQQTETAIQNPDATADFEDEIAEILQRWAQQVVALGVYPKGYFTCDFRSPDPSAFLCWTYGEHAITHTHKVWETFKDRKPIEDPRLNGISMSLN